MNTEYLLLSVATATFGFLIWYAASATLRLPKKFQVQFDINKPFTNRYLRRRILIFLLYVLVPYVLIMDFHVLGTVSLDDLGIHFSWNSRATFWTLVLVPVVIFGTFFYSKQTSNLVEFPEIRVTLWTPRIYLMSSISWAFQIFALEFLYRGLLLQSLRMSGLSDLTAILLSTGIYALSHYFKGSVKSFISIPYGVLACYIVIDSNSLLPVFIIHLSNALFTEWFSVRRHPEMRSA